MDGENVVERSVVAFGPKVRVGAGVDELGGHAHLVARAPHAAFEDVRDAELRGDLAQVAR